MNDNLEARVRAANPVATHARPVLTDRALADLQRIMSEPPAAARPRRRRHPIVWIGASVAATMAIVIVLLIPNVIAGQRAVAATPPLLTVAPVTGSAADLLRELAVNVARKADTVTPNETSYQTWAAQLTITEDDDQSHVIQPEVVTSRWETDLSGAVRIVAGEPYPAAGAPRDAGPAQGVQAPGTVLSDDVLDAGEYPLVFAAEPPVAPQAMRAYLLQATDTPNSNDAAVLFRCIQAFLSQRNPTPAQESAILAVLQTADGISVLGSVTDRLGRPGVAFAASTNEGAQLEHLLIVSPDGTLLGAETIYRGGGSINLPNPSVMEYIVWKRS